MIFKPFFKAFTVGKFVIKSTRFEKKNLFFPSALVLTLGVLSHVFTTCHTFSSLHASINNTSCVHTLYRCSIYLGLRGAIAFALAIRNTSTESRQLMVSATMMIVIITVILGGGLTTPMLGWLQIRSDLELM